MPFVTFFPLQKHHQSIERELKQAFAKIIAKGRFILDEEVDRFEKELASFHRMKHCVSLGNGHDAILISLKALGIGKGDEVIVPSHTFMATWLAVVNAGAKPVPVEVDESTYNINHNRIEEKISSKTKAIIPVHLYGYPCEMDKINSAAKKNNSFVIEDNAQAHGAFFKNKMTGSWGDCNATSFYPIKNLGALGDGGAILTNNKKLFEFAKAFRNYGSTKKGFFEIQGINSRLDELQAAILRVKLKRLNAENESRRKNAAIYFEELKDVKEIKLPPPESKTVSPVFHQFVVRTSERKKLTEFLKKKGVQTAIHYPEPIHTQKAFANLGYKKGSLPIAEKISKEVLSLPIWPGLKKSEVNYVADAVRKFYL
ncbi:MAG: DegT/DnrJ/EryC1/StrS family aminotransferase [Cyclobacteriaceae bacterium]